MKSKLFLILFLLNSLAMFSSVDSKIDRQLIVRLAEGKQPKDIVELNSYEYISNVLSVDMNIWSIEFKISIDDKLIENFRTNRDIISYFKNKPIQLRNTNPNDPKFSFQTHHLYDVTPPKTIPYGINAVGAWDFNKQGTTSLGDTIVIAIVDAGMENSHVDLDYFTNYREIPNDSIDNDNNGYIDDYKGWNATRNSGVLNAFGSTHGTQVSGGAGAIGNNSIGVSGVSWNVKILPICFDLGNEGRAGLIKSYDYLIKQRKEYNNSNGKRGAYIVAINTSIGATFSDATEDSIWCSMYDSFANYGILSTVATANETNKTVEEVGDIPSLCQSPYMIAVTALGNDLSSDFSAYSMVNVDLAAPDAYYTTIPSNNFGFSPRGSSTSAPLVSGAIGLIYSNLDSTFLKEIKLKPKESILKIRDAIFDGVDITDPLKLQVKTKGKLNVFKAVQNARTLRGAQSAIESVSNIEDDIYSFENKIYVNKVNTLPLAIKLYDMLGREVTRIENIKSSHSYELSGLNTGIYILHSLQEGQKTASKKIEIY